MPTRRSTSTAPTNKRASRLPESIPALAPSSTAAATPPPLPAALLTPAFLEVAPDAIVVTDAAGHILLVNHQTEALFGSARADLLGQTVELLLPERLHARHQRHRAIYVANPHTRPMGSGLELVGRRQDGSEFPVEVSLSPLPLGNDTLVIAVLRDVTERRRIEATERALRAVHKRQQALLQMVLDELPGGAYLVRGPDAELVLANRAAAEVWGASWPIGQSMAAFMEASEVRYESPTGQSLTLDELVTLQIVRGGAPLRHVREVVRRPDGQRLAVLVSAVALDAAVLAMPGEEFAAPGERAEWLALVLLQDLSVVQAAEQVKDEFISLATHELRTPLAAIQGFASMLRVQTALGHGADLADWQQEAVEEIESASQRLNALVDDLLEATRIEANRVQLRMAPLDLVMFLRRCVRARQVTTTAHTLTLESSVDTVDPLMVAADSARLEQVVGNLLSNAIKYSPEGGSITVSVEVEPAYAAHAAGEADETDATAESAKTAQQVTVRISDQGIGIPVDEQAQLFQRFARASNGPDHGIPGAGLGLFVCRELLERQGGSIWFESTEGVGTTFFLTLPVTLPLVLQDASAPE